MRGALFVFPTKTNKQLHFNSCLYHVTVWAIEAEAETETACHVMFSSTTEEYVLCIITSSTCTCTCMLLVVVHVVYL